MTATRKVPDIHAVLGGSAPVILAGLTGFFLVVGWPALNPLNILWLEGGDSAQHYLGWKFFRQAPWSFPLGANPDYGLELGSSIVYSDSIPGLALFFKIFAGVLPPEFQYFGIWLLACFVLQAFMGWKLMCLISERAMVRIFGSLLFLFAPPFLWRVGVHMALASQWLILAALYLVLRPADDRRTTLWATLLCAATLVHAYLFAMVASLWAADFLGRRPWSGKGMAAFAEPGVVLGVSGLSMWLCGYFMLGYGGITSALFGQYPMNLLAPIDADGWSYLLGSIPKVSTSHEGFNFFGLGMILLAALVLPAMCTRRSEKLPSRFRPLLSVLILLTLFALTNDVSVGPVELIWFSLPRSVESALNTFQSSGRFFWPVFYTIVWLIIRAILKSYSPRVVAALLLVAASVQVLDTSAAWLQKRDAMQPTGEKWETRLTSPFWSEAAARYRRLQMLPPRNLPEHWIDLAYYAAEHAMPTDAVYLARVDPQHLHRARIKGLLRIGTGRLDPNVLYVLEPNYVKTVARNLPPGVGTLRYVDGIAVLAPGWHPCDECPEIDSVKQSDGVESRR